MPINTIGNPAGWADRRRTRQQDQSPTGVLTTPANWDDDAALEAALTAANAGLYTAAKLSQMTYNDKVYALRRLTEAAGAY